MSDGIWIALITGGFGLLTAISVAMTNHFLGRKDRALASETVSQKNRELRQVRARLRRLERENQRLRLRSPRPRQPR